MKKYSSARKSPKRSVHRSTRRSAKRRSKRKSRVRIPVKKGTLEGYSVYDLARDRRKLLVKLIKTGNSTYSQIIKRLNVLVIYNKNRYPDIADKVLRDLEYIQRHMSHYSKQSAKKSSPKRSPKPKPKSKTKSVKKRVREIN
jgi:hypothetical protein